MADYKKMYYKLFRAMTQAIIILQEAQKETEEMFMAAEDTKLTVLERKPEDNPSESNDNDNKKE